MLHLICQQIWKTQQWPQGWKRSVFIPIPKKGNAEECSDYHTIALTSHASKVMLKILQVKLQQHVNCELPDVQAGFKKGRGTRDQIANIAGSSKKQDSSRKTSTSALLTKPKPLIVWTTTNWKILQEMAYQTTWPASWETCMQVRKQQLGLDMEEQTGSKSKKECLNKTVYCILFSENINIFISFFCIRAHTHTHTKWCKLEFDVTSYSEFKTSESLLTQHNQHLFFTQSHTMCWQGH